MTYAEYNTDKNFDNDKSSLDELIKIGVSEGKSSDEIKKSLSPKWQNSKKIGEFDSYYNKYTAPKSETKEEVKETVTEAPKNTTTLDKTSQNYVNKQNKIAEAAKETVINDIEKDSDYNWKSLKDSSEKRAAAYKNIDDHFIEQLPIFMFKRYANGEFGDPKSSDAKLRLTYFMVDGLQNKLKNASNLFNNAAGRGGVFSDTTSAYEKYQATNLEEGMANRWNKYKADTEGAIKEVEKLYGNEQDARLAAEQFTRDQKANTYWNMMDQNKKVYALQVSKEIGDMLGGMDTKELASLIAGSAMTGDMTKDELIGIGIAQLASKTPELLEKYPDAKAFLTNVFGDNAVTEIAAGIGGVGGKTDSNGNQTNLTGNLQNYETINGDKVSFDFTDSKAKEKITAITDDLKDKYANGEIDVETFKKYYDPIYSEMIKHPSAWGSAPKSDKVLNQIKYDKLNAISSSFEELNSKADSGAISTSDYEEQFDDILANARKWGADEKMISTIQKKKKSSEYILKKAEKAAKKNK